MDQSLYMHILKLRLLIGAAGERTAPPWWRTQFLSSTGLKYLQRLFPRTALRAGLESVCLAAAQDHDQHVGGRSFHLYRLTSDIELRLADLLAGPEPSRQLTVPGPDLGSVIAELETLADGAKADSGLGPKKLGNSKQILRNAMVRQLAAVYLVALQEGTRVYPYFEEVL